MTALVVSSAAAGPRPPTDKSDNVRLIKNFPYEGGTELAFDRDFVYAGQWDGHTDRGENATQGGIKIFDAAGPAPKEVGFLHCPGNDNDVGVVRPGIVSLGFHSNTCFPLGSGVLLVDVKNPRRPAVLGGVQVPGGVHTQTPYPGTPYIYTSPGGGWSPTSEQSIIDTSNPAKPKVVTTFKAVIGGCHDWSFYIDRETKLGFCAGGGGDWADGEISIWDVSDPLNPTLISQIVNPMLQFPHYAIASPDGGLLVVQDENYMAHECYTGMTPLGSIWIYDISDPRAPILRGHADPPRGDDGVGTLLGWVPSWCTSHHYNFVPGTRMLVTGWYTAGTNVLDLSDPLAPEEVAYFLPDDAIVWTAHWHEGRIYISDFSRGLDVIEVKGLKEGR
jgi:hypothetical protein